jgi:hypothetical protein
VWHHPMIARLVSCGPCVQDYVVIYKITIKQNEQINIDSQSIFYAFSI